MKEDVEFGWWHAPAGEYWKCPECGETTRVENWEEQTVGCEDCGEHDGRECPECGEVFDHVWGSHEILLGRKEDVKST